MEVDLTHSEWEKTTSGEVMTVFETDFDHITVEITIETIPEETRVMVFVDHKAYPNHGDGAFLKGGLTASEAVEQTKRMLDKNWGLIPVLNGKEFDHPQVVKDRAFESKIFTAEQGDDDGVWVFRSDDPAHVRSLARTGSDIDEVELITTGEEPVVRVGEGGRKRETIDVAMEKAKDRYMR